MGSIVFWGGEWSGDFYDWNKDKFSKTAWAVSAASYQNSEFVLWRRTGEGYRAGRVLEVRQRFRNLFHGIGVYPDGVGTKVVPHASMQMHPVAAHDIGAMTLDDAATQGDRPVSFNSVLDARDINEDVEYFTRMIEELWKIAKQQGVVLLAWETANLGACVSTPDPKSKSAFNWAGFATSLKHPLIHHPEGNKTNFGKLEPGNVVVALKQWGFRSNGISAVRRAFEAQYGTDWYRSAPLWELQDAFQASEIYAAAVAQALGWNNFFSVENVSAEAFAFPVDVRWICHLSGGSFRGKMHEGLLQPNQVSAVLDNLYPTPEIVRKVFAWQQNIPEKLSRRPDVTSLEDVYGTFCVWQWMLVVVWDAAEAGKFIRIMKENGIDSQVAGEIVANKKSTDSSLEISGDHISVD